MTDLGRLSFMANRHDREDERDFYPTPPWAARALCDRLVLHMRDRRLALREMWCMEPACGRGDMVMALQSYFRRVYASDIAPATRPGFSCRAERMDFFEMKEPPEDPADGWLITNPPFRLAEDFLRHAWALGMRHIALFVRLQWLESSQRYLHVFSRGDLRPDLVLVFAERVPILRGRLLRRASSATSYCWVVWSPLVRADDGETRLAWIPPGTRRQLERAGDYDDDFGPREGGEGMNEEAATEAL